MLYKSSCHLYHLEVMRSAYHVTKSRLQLVEKFSCSFYLTLTIQFQSGWLPSGWWLPLPVVFPSLTEVPSSSSITSDALFHYSAMSRHQQISEACLTDCYFNKLLISEIRELKCYFWVEFGTRWASNMCHAARVHLCKHLSNLVSASISIVREKLSSSFSLNLFFFWNSLSFYKLTTTCVLFCRHKTG